MRWTKINKYIKLFAGLFLFFICFVITVYLFEDNYIKRSYKIKSLIENDYELSQRFNNYAEKFKYSDKICVKIKTRGAGGDCIFCYNIQNGNLLYYRYQGE